MVTGRNSLGDASLRLWVDDRDLDKGFDKSERTSKGRAKKLGLLAAGAVGAGLAAGFAAFKAHEVIDEAFATIRSGTGATGDALRELEQSFLNVNGTVVASEQQIAAAMAEVNTRLGLTGQALENTTRTALQMSDALGIDATAAIRSTAQSLEIFGLPAEQAVAHMDKMFVVSQQTGVGVDELSSQIQTFGPVLKNAGYTLDETTALFANMNAQGIDVTRVMPGINMATRRLAEEGVTDLRGALESTIERIANAKTDTEALNIATEMFGAEGAQRMTVGIRNGVFALDDLIGAMGESEGAIDDNDRATRTLSETFGLLRQELTEKLAGAFNLVYSFIQDKFAPVWENLVSYWQNSLLPAIQDLWEWLGPQLQDVMADIEHAWQQNVRPALIEMQRIFVDHIVPAIQDYVAPAVAWMVEKLLDFSGWVIRNKTILYGLAAFFGVLATALAVKTAAIIAATVATAAWGVAVGIATGGIIPLLGLLVAAGVMVWQNWDTIVEKGRAAWDAITDFIGKAIVFIANRLADFVEGLPFIGGKMAATIRETADKIQGSLDRMGHGVDETTEGILKSAENLQGSLPGPMGAVQQELDDTGQAAKDAAADSDQSMADILASAENLQGSMPGPMGAVQQTFVETAESAETNLANQDGTGRVQEAFKAVEIDAWAAGQEVEAALDDFFEQEQRRAEGEAFVALVQSQLGGLPPALREIFLVPMQGMLGEVEAELAETGEVSDATQRQFQTAFGHMEDYVHEMAEAGKIDAATAQTWLDWIGQAAEDMERQGNTAMANFLLDMSNMADGVEQQAKRVREAMASTIAAQNTRLNYGTGGTDNSLPAGVGPMPSMKDAFQQMLDDGLVDQAGYDDLVDSLGPSLFGHGGIVTGPTLGMIGEDPATLPEVVMPLERLEAMMSGSSGRQPTIENHYHLDTVYGYEDFAEKVAQAELTTSRRGRVDFR